METLRVSTKQITYRDFEPFFEGPVRVSLTKEASNNIERSNTRLLSILDTKETIYGVNTGFGNLSHITIEPRDQKQLQINLVRSHAAGSGEPLGLGIVRTVLFLKLLTFAHGYSGVRLALAKKIIQFINKDIIP